ncbi:unnamed protein product [Cunninghamella echinulata]
MLEDIKNIPLCSEAGIAAIKGYEGHKDCLYPHPNRCDQFIYCKINSDGKTGIPITKDCPANLLWNRIKFNVFILEFLIGLSFLKETGVYYQKSEDLDVSECKPQDTEDLQINFDLISLWKIVTTYAAATAKKKGDYTNNTNECCSKKGLNIPINQAIIINTNKSKICY